MATAMVQVNVRLTPELHKRLKAQATSQHTTATAVVTEALDAYLAIITPRSTKGVGKA